MLINDEKTIQLTEQLNSKKVTPRDISLCHLHINVFSDDLLRTVF